ncbi:MAG: SpoIID/LytB domain-containing protein [Chlamydiae bacterium]|nr:SpoIID/LytB domain-containing protein [Chlamydiota bacterium]
MNFKALIFSGLLIAVSPFISTTSAYSYEIPTDVSLKAKPATVRVLLSEQQHSVILEAKGKYQVCNPLNNFVLFNGSYSKKAKVTAESSGFRWGDPIPGTFQMRIVPMDSETTILVNGIQYRGCIELYGENGMITVVNEVDVESYLRSTLCNKFRQETNQEVLNAVAIVARTNTYHLLNKKRGSEFFHVKAQDVSYRGHGATMQNATLENAISNTRHAILTLNQKPFAATWNENSAGKTADYSSIFRINTPCPNGVEVPLAESERQKLGWSFSATKEQLANIAHIAKISKISLFSEKNSGKVYAIKISDGSNSQDVDFFSLQKALGENKLKSNDFSVEVKGDIITFKGYGQGCGTGLCLYSASMMAQHGQDASKILSTFFPGTKVQKVRALSPQN